MINEKSAKNYLKLFIRRNEILNQFNFNNKNSQDSMSSLNTKYIEINGFLTYGLNLMGTEERQNLYVEMAIIKEKASTVIRHIVENGILSASSVEKLNYCDSIIQGVASFEFFAKTMFPQEFTEEIIDGLFEKRYSEYIQSQNNNEQQGSTQKIESTYKSLTDGINEEYTSNIPKPEKPNEEHSQEAPTEVDIKLNSTQDPLDVTQEE